MTTPDFSLLEAVRRQCPLIHCVSNLVSAGDCANLALAVGASPWRLERVEELLEKFTPTLLRVNSGEARALLRLESRARGVDGPAEPDFARRGELALWLARERGTAVLVSGPEDLISDGTALWKVSGGSPLMTRVTGTGGMLSVLCGVFAAVEPDILTAAGSPLPFLACRRDALRRAPAAGGAFVFRHKGQRLRDDAAEEGTHQIPVPAGAGKRNFRINAIR